LKNGRISTVEGAGVAKSGWPESRMAGSYQLSTWSLMRSTGSLSRPSYQLTSIHSGSAQLPNLLPNLYMAKTRIRSGSAQLPNL
jgi:hypothetical protein